MASIEPLRGDPFPWYRSHGRAALITATILFVAVTGLHLLVNGTGQAVDILYALPIALLAVSFGLRGGLVGAAVGFALFAVVEVFHGVGDIDVTGWVTRGAGLFLLGVLLGQAADQIEVAEHRTIAAMEERRALAERTRRQTEALEISDSIIQHLAVAKWMIEAGNPEAAITILTTTMATGERMVADLLPVRRGDVDTGGPAPTRVPDTTPAGSPDPGPAPAVPPGPASTPAVSQDPGPTPAVPPDPDSVRTGRGTSA